MTTASAPEGC